LFIDIIAFPHHYKKLDNIYNTGKILMQKDFSYPLTVAELPSAPQHYELNADKDNLIYLADVLQVPAVKKVFANINLQRRHATSLIEVEGHINAILELESVISLEKFDQDYDFDFHLIYDTAATFESTKGDNWQEETPDIVINGQIDLGNIVIEQIALQIDDYPRKPGEVFNFEAEFDPNSEKSNNPFDMLAKLKK